MRITVIDEIGFTGAQIATIMDALGSHGEKVVKAYGITGATYVLSPKGTTLTGPTILLTERKPKGVGGLTALGYRVVESGIPVVYASLKASGKLFGVYTKPFVLRGRQINPARIRNGYITVLCHELSELLVAPMMDQFSLPDNAGKSWRKEVCDPVLGSYYFENVKGQDCVFPDFVLPSFWDPKGVAPFSYLGSKTGPLIWAKGSYAWFKTAVSKLTKVFY